MKARETTPDGSAAARVELVRRPEGLTLTGDGMEVRGDFARMLSRVRPGKLERELLVRAAKVKGTASPVAVDATAGLGEDSFLLAAAGFQVRMYESDPAIAALLRDALARAKADPSLAGIACRMELFEEDSVRVMAALAETGERTSEGADTTDSAAATDEQAPSPAFGTHAPDVIYLDPMFPERRKSAAVKKKFQLIHHLEKPCSNEEEMLLAAIRANPRKVVVKRPAKGPYLANIKPSYSIAGKAVRYDCITPASVKL